jgi:hypothetical protein
MNGIFIFIAGFLASTLVSQALVFYLGVPIGKQARYLGLALLHPRHMLHGRWLCPACLGSGAGESSELYRGGPCFFCFHLQHLADGTTAYDADSVCGHARPTRFVPT